MVTKLPTIEIFMTPIDELNFSNKLLSEIPSVKFIDISIWNSPNPILINSISDSTSIHKTVVIINTNITSLDTYKENYISKHEIEKIYSGSSFGPGIIQFLRSKEAEYNPGGLRNGRLSASYNAETEPNMDEFVKSVYKIFKKHALKLYAIDVNTGAVSTKMSNGILSWPNAVLKFDRANGKYLTNNAMSYFTSKKP